MRSDPASAVSPGAAEDSVSRATEVVAAPPEGSAGHPAIDRARDTLIRDRPSAGGEAASRPEARWGSQP
jgi:hypothetical protein